MHIICILLVWLPYFTKASEHRIHEGSVAEIGKFPYQVFIQRITARGAVVVFCGGSIISKRYVLTAAHCLNKFRKDKLLVVVGTNSLVNHNESAVYESESTIIHERYNPNKPALLNDIALIRVNKDIEFNEFVQPVKLAKAGHVTKAGARLSISGWGRTSEKGPRLKDLLMAKIKVVDSSHCPKFGKHESLMCYIGVKIPTASSCRGDSGGPAVNKNGVQVGIIKSSLKCGALKIPSVLTRVSYFSNWIKEKTLDEGSAPLTKWEKIWLIQKLLNDGIDS
ncbi:hypothetical protein TKK_0011444 [Trichogramma kaykai]|uniref:Peptidase S1 domain-containing protein n=1 Tax=Trichogramma kaykai TaxID=54128 RepID=A0ABD2WRF6_9HYME